MEQGPLGRQPPGHERRDPRRFLRDAVVFDDYTIHEGMILPQGAIRTRYNPATCPELPQKLARLVRGHTAAALAFVRTYGLLGYTPLARRSAVVSPATRQAIPWPGSGPRPRRSACVCS